MANPTVEKLKALGIRHGEKAALAVTGLLFLFFAYQSAAKPTIDITADKVKEDANAANQNISRGQKREEILAKLEGEGYKDPGFEQKVVQQESKAVDAKPYLVDNAWVTPEPGAGLIRDKPVLLAATDLNARAGRGGILVYELKDGERVPVEDEGGDAEAPRASRRKRRSASPMAMGGGMMGGMGGGNRTRRRGTGAAAEQARREADLEKIQKEQGLAGDVDEEKEAKEEKKDEANDTTKYKEVVQGYHWVALVAGFPHKQQRENYSKALKLPLESSHPSYVRVDVQRQTRNKDGSWPDPKDDSQWENVDTNKNYEVLENHPEEEDELAPQEVRFAALVDPLPFLKAGFWKEVHLKRLVPREEREAKTEVAANASSSDSSMASFMMKSQREAQQMQQMMGQQRQQAARAAKMMGAMSAAQGGGMRAMMGGGGGGGGAGGAPVPEADEKSEVDELMIRALDFTVEPDMTYRYRVRVVFRNPNLNYDLVTPGVDNKTKLLKGPWSDPSNETTVPPDVTLHVAKRGQAGASDPRPEVVDFQVASFSPEDGLDVVKTYSAGYGEVIGDVSRMTVPNLDPDTKKPRESQTINFNTRQMLTDVYGGAESLAQLGVGGGALDVPVTTVLLRPDGRIAVRDQVRDSNDVEMKAMRESWTQAKEKGAKQKRKRRRAGGMMGGGMMGGMGRM